MNGKVLPGVSRWFGLRDIRLVHDPRAPSMIANCLLGYDPLCTHSSSHRGLLSAAAKGPSLRVLELRRIAPWYATATRASRDSAII